MNTFKIKNRFTNAVIFSGEYKSLKECVEDAVEKGISLRNANLNSVNLICANLESANLEGANLESANLVNVNLLNANLENADLGNVNLFDTIGNKKHIKSLQLETYNITYTSEVLQIGCENHSIEDWKTFTDKQILHMDGKTALYFWNKYKEIIFNIIELSPAFPTKTKVK